MIVTRSGITLLTLFLSVTAWAGSSPKRITAVRTATPPVIDGLLNEPQWQSAPPATEFTQFDPYEGEAPTESTAVHILYDDRAVYIGVMCYDSNPAGIVRQLTRRDRTSEADRFTVQVDSYQDNQTAFVFSANVSGVQSDGVLSQNGLVYDISWDAVWQVQTSVHADGWSVEFAIPYHALRFAERSGDYEWGINFRRYISRKRETVEWVMIPRSEMVAVSLWGKVTGISNIKPPIHLSVLPYVLGRTTIESATQSRSSRTDHHAAAGLDIKYGPSQNFTLDATINPDFGQVEVDQSVLNLTVFETRFPEKRPFFLEGAQLFTFGSAVDNTSHPLFFSRRIGRRPTLSGSVFPPAGGEIVKNPQTTTILGATKLTGRTESGFSLGVIAAGTGEENATLRDSTGREFTVRTESQGLYSILRMKQEAENNSYLGGIATLVARESSLPAISGGIDWNVRTGDGTHAFDGFVAATHSTASEDGFGGRAMFARISARHWFYETSYEFFTEDFDPNDAGFFAQPREHGGFSQLIYRENFATAPLRRYAFSLHPEYRWNWNGNRTRLDVIATAIGEFTNFWATTLTHTLGLPSYVDRERGLFGLHRRYTSQDIQLSLQSDERQSVSGTLTAGTEFDARKKSSHYALLSLKLRPAPWMELSPYGLYARTRAEETGVFSGGTIVVANGGSLFADRDVDQVDIGMRGIVTFTRSLSLQFFAQVLFARGHHLDYRILVDEATFVMPGGPVPNFDFNFVVFNANMLLRWEYLPGSTLYLVWTQGRFDYIPDFTRSFGSRLGDTFRSPHEDVLLLKVSYWLPL
jgi:hypothetical protein